MYILILKQSLFLTCIWTLLFIISIHTSLELLRQSVQYLMHTNSHIFPILSPTCESNAYTV